MDSKGRGCLGTLSTHSPASLTPPSSGSILGLTSHIANWVETKQRTIDLGMERRWVDVEADEVTFAKRLCGRTLTKSNPEIAPISVRTTQLCFLYLS